MTGACTHTLPLLLCQTHTLHLRRVYKTFNCELFHAGDNPWAYLRSEDIFCGQLEDESQRRRNNGTREEKGENKIRICLVEERQRDSSVMLHVFSCQLLFGTGVQRGHTGLIPVALEATLLWPVFMLRRVKNQWHVWNICRLIPQWSTLQIWNIRF